MMQPESKPIREHISELLGEARQHLFGETQSQSQAGYQ